MLRIVKKTILFTLTLLSVSVTSTVGQAIPFNDCGVLIEGPDELVLFSSFGNFGELFTLENYGQFAINDSVCVTGMVDYSCMFDTLFPGDTLNYFPCVIENDIDSLGSFLLPFNGNGVLVEVSGCLLFTSLYDSGYYIQLSNYADFAAGDTVYVSGMLTDSCGGMCPQAHDCLTNNNIMGVDQPPIPMPGRVIVGLEPGSSAIPFFAQYNLILRDSTPNQSIYLAEYIDTLGVENIITILESDSRVVFVEPNFEFEIPGNLQMSMSFPDENRPPLVLGSSPPGYYEQAAIYSVGIDTAQQIARGSNISIAVIDNGVSFTHPLLQEHLLPNGYDYLDGDVDPGYTAGAAASHGTFVSGLIVRTAPEASILPLRAFDGDGVGNTFAIVQSIYHAIDANVDIINMSFGMSEYNHSLETACSTAIENGIVLVAAGGNEGAITPMFPAALPNVLAVSAVDSLDYLASFSNYGGYLDICAPGVLLYSSLAGEYEWGSWSGTSFAAALVSATAALIKELDSDMTPYALDAHLKQTAQQELHGNVIYPHDFYYAYGRLDAGEAVWSLDGPLPLCGDFNSDMAINVADPVYLIQYIFHGGPPPERMYLSDANCDGMVNLGDAVHMLNYIFKNGIAPCCE